jgi:hypothetical protein
MDVFSGHDHLETWLATPAADQVNDQDHHCDDQQDMDEAAGHVKAEAEKPQNQQNYKDCPKHKSPL